VGIPRAFASRREKGLTVSPQIKDLNRMLRDVPAMPAVAQRVMHLLGDPRTTNSVLGDALASDQAMAARVLQMANSPFFGTRQKISSISNAVFVLGHSALRSLIITVCTKGLYKNPGLMERKNWEHSLGSATAARHLAEKTGLMDQDEAFTGGLLHDIGRTMLMIADREAYQALFERDYNQDFAPDGLIALEKEEFGYDHCEVGAPVILKWRLPGIYARIARRHHATSSDVIEREEDPKAIALVAQANLIAHRVGLGRHEPDEQIDVMANIYNEMLGIGREMTLEIVKLALRDYKDAREQFSL